jgi:hypothetical protein
MPNRSRKKKTGRDPVVIARSVVDHVTGASASSEGQQPAIVRAASVKPESEKDPAAVALGRKGGLKGGKARAAKLTKEQLSESGKKAARARWEKRK